VRHAPLHVRGQQVLNCKKLQYIKPIIYTPYNLNLEYVSPNPNPQPPTLEQGLRLHCRPGDARCGGGLQVAIVVVVVRIVVTVAATTIIIVVIIMVIIIIVTTTIAALCPMAALARFSCGRQGNAQLQCR